jgi:hypothetical protein
MGGAIFQNTNQNELEEEKKESIAVLSPNK